MTLQPKRFGWVCFLYAMHGKQFLSEGHLPLKPNSGKIPTIRVLKVGTCGGCFCFVLVGVAKLWTSLGFTSALDTCIRSWATNFTLLQSYWDFPDDAPWSQEDKHSAQVFQGRSCEGCFTQPTPQQQGDTHFLFLVTLPHSYPVLTSFHIISFSKCQLEKALNEKEKVGSLI